MRRSFTLLFSKGLAKPRGYWDYIPNQKLFIDTIIKKENLHNDKLKILKLNSSLINKYGGYSLLNKYPSVNIMLNNLYPEISWKKDNLIVIKDSDDKSCKIFQKKLLEDIRNNEYFDMEEWYNKSGNFLKQYNCGFLLSLYPSYMDCIMNIYSDYKWDPLLFRYKSKYFWNNLDNQRLYMKSLEKQFKIKKPSDWLQVNVAIFRKEGGAIIFRLYPTFLNLLKSIYPEEQWNTLHKRIPRRYWENPENVTKFMDNFALKFNIKESKDWFNVSHVAIKNEVGGSGLLSWYKYSLHNILATAYPSKDWLHIKEQYIKEKRKNMPIEKTVNIEEARKIFDNIGEKLGVKEYTDWYKIPVANIKEHTNIIRKFSNKYTCFKTIYPEYEWNVLLFDRVPNKCWFDPEIKKQFFEYVKKELNISTEQLLTIPLKTYFKLGGTGLMKAHGSRKYEIIADVYPEIKQHKSLNPDFWKDINNQKEWISTIEKHLDIQSPLNWKYVTVRTLTELGGSPLIQQYGSIKNILTHFYPNKDWTFLQQHMPNKYWQKRENQILFFKQVLDKEGLSHINQLQSISQKNIVKHGGGSLLSYYPSYYDCLVTLFPEEKWDPFEFSILPRSFWDNKANHRLFFDRYAKKYNIKSPEDWKNITVADIKKEKGSRVLVKYSSFYDALQSNYPEYDWNVFSTRKTVPRNYWKSEENCKAFLDKFSKDHNITCTEDWEKITKADIIVAGGSGLLFQSGIIKILKRIYPSTNWNNIIEATRVPIGYWDDRDNINNFINSLKEKYRIKQPSDWLRVSVKQISESGGQALLRKFNGMYNLLCYIYPNEKWNKSSFSIRDKRSVQRLLFVLLQEIFKDEEIIEEFIHNKLTRELGKAVEFDIYLPKYNIAIEYHGKQHYKEIPSFGMLEMYQSRDIEKEKLCIENNIYLIVIPYWWNCTITQLKGTLGNEIGSKFPELFPRPYYKPIPKKE